MKPNYSFLILLLSIIFIQSNAQSTYCPPNIDFEAGNYGYWKFYTGTCCPISTLPSAQISGRHTLTSGTALDLYGNFPVLAPNGGNYSLKLGNNGSGSQAEKAAYYVHIPPGLNNYSLIYNYAVVFEDPNHQASDQPRFEVKAIDSATNTPIACAQFTYVSGSGLPGFVYNTLYDVWWRGWSTASLDLSGLAGHTIIVSFASGDCALGGHFGYGYVDLACSLFEISSVICNGQATQTFSAPPGFMTYQWYDSSYTNIIDTGQIITIPTPPQNSVYHVVLTPYPGYGCGDTLTSVVTIANVSNSVVNQTICAPNSFDGYSQTGVYIDTFVNIAGCDSVRTLNLTVIPIIDTIINKTICSNDTFLGYNTTGTHIDTFTSSMNACDSIRIINLLVQSSTTTVINQSICEPDTFMGHTTGGIYIDSFLNVNGCDSIIILNLTVKLKTYGALNQIICEPNSYLGYSQSGMYVDTLINAQGCDSIRTLFLTVNPITFSIINKSICDSTSFEGYSLPGTYIDTLQNAKGCDSIRTINLTVNQVYFADTTLTICRGNKYFAGGAWQSTEGFYVDSLVTNTGCDSVIFTHLFIKDVLFPFLGNDTTICLGDSLLLYPGIFNYYNWWDGDTTSDRKIVYNAGWYYVTVSNDKLCFATDSLLLSTYSLPLVQIIYSVKDLCRGDTIQLLGSGALSYEWYLNHYYTTPKYTEDNINFTLNAPTSITLIGTDTNHCKNKDEITLFYIPCCGNISVPNAFSPNGDGNNDFFHVLTDAAFENFSLKVYNRWGLLVFSAKNSKEKWDGKYKGVDAELGSYYYFLQTKCWNEKSNMIKGDVLLMR